MGKNLIFFLGACLFSIFCLYNTSYAGGPPLSRAFVFCETEGDAFEDYPLHLSEFLTEDLADLGEALYVHGFWLEQNTPGVSYEAQSAVNAKSVENDLYRLESSCKNNVSELKMSLLPRLEAWVDKINDAYGQGSLFIIAPYSEENISLIETVKFPEIGTLRDFPFLIIEEENGWIYAYTSDSSPFSWVIISGIVLVLVATFFLAYHKV